MTTTDRSTPPLTAAQGALAAQWLPLARLIARPYTVRYPEAADDFVGQALLVLCRAARDYDPAHKVPFQGFARQRIQWALVDLERQVVTRRIREQGEPVRDHRLDSAPGPLEQLEAAEGRAGRVERVMGLLAGLRGTPRKVVELAYLHGLADAEIADRLGLAEITAKHYRHRAAAAIRGRLAG